MRILIIIIITLSSCIHLFPQEIIVGNYNHNFYYDAEPLKKIDSVKWQYKTLGNGSFMPLVYKGVVYSGDAKGNLYAIDCNTGKEIWIFKAEGRLFNGPSIKEKTLFFGTFAGILYALDLNTGKEKWRIQTGGSVCFPPTFHKEKGFIQSHDTNLYIFDLHNGTVIDTVKGDNWMCGIPSITDNHLYYSDWGGNLNSLDLESVEKEWTFHTGPYSRRYTCPSYLDSIAYFVTFDSILSVVNLNTGKALWRFKADDKIMRSPAIAKNLIAFTTFNSHFYVIDRIKQAVLWEYKSEGRNNSHPIIVGDVVYFGSGSGTLFAFDIHTGNKLWEYTLEAAVNTPFFSNNAIYFASGPYIYKIE
jgi:outer membrane protein assembly factor BamB